MTCSVRSAIVCATVLFTAAVAQAQTTATPATPPHRLALEVTAAATLGHTSDKSFGAEGNYALNPKMDVFVEGGHVGNAATSDFDARVHTIGAAVNASTSAVQRVNFLDGGIRYHLRDYTPTLAKLHQYVAAGLGFAQVKNETTFSVNGASVVPEALGISLGSDLSGTHNRPFIMLGLGGNVPFQKRYFVDFGYRYGHAFGETADGETVLAGINVSRLQIGVGITF